MSDSARHETEKDAINKIRGYESGLNASDLSKALMEGDRSALSRSITLLESTNENHGHIASEIIQKCVVASGKSIRIGITGIPGVGKSTFIDVFGSYLISLGKKVAVLAIDPSSPLSKGSILGDKTRMDELSVNSNAFIRPSPAAQTLGGVARKTRETVLLCEAAGYDVILIETVGVGQSEISVHGMTDFFLLLMLAGAGDQLQGIKRGIMEMCDAILITKADGDNMQPAGFAKGEYSNALHLFPAKESGWTPKVEVVSALEKKGIKEVWELITHHEKWMKERNLFYQNRDNQDIHWMHETIKSHAIEMYYSRPENIEKIKESEAMLKSGKISAFEAARRVYESDK